MFRSKRSSLVKRLWKNRLNNETTGKNETSEELEIKSVAQSMLKRLKEKQLETMVQSIESKGGESTGCVLLPKGDLRLGRRSVAPHILCCKLWRWQDISSSSELKRLSYCTTSGDDPAYICCNPYHWSILHKTVSSWAGIEQIKLTDSGCEDVLMDEGVSTETGNTPTAHRYDISDDSSSTNGGTRGPHWCTVAYWELRQRVGRLFTVTDPYINIFQSLPHGNGLSLEILQEDTDMDSVRRTRDKIGYGCVLSQEDDGIWVYNRSSYPIFVNSPTLDTPNSRTSTVLKVMPGYSVKIFDYDFVRLLKGVKDPRLLDGPYDPTSLRISFAKGWGPSYHRQFITSCPCWLEVLLNLVDR